MGIVVFSNAPRKYVLRCLEVLGVRDCFHDDLVFGVEDVLPACKPEPATFERVLNAVGTTASRTVMFEDSMKNIRACHALGLHTVLIDETSGKAVDGEAGLLGDIPVADDPAVDVALENIDQIREQLPFLWEKRFERKAGPSQKVARKE